MKSRFSLLLLLIVISLAVRSLSADIVPVPATAVAQLVPNSVTVPFSDTEVLAALAGVTLLPSQANGAQGSPTLPGSTPLSPAPDHRIGASLLTHPLAFHSSRVTANNHGGTFNIFKQLPGSSPQPLLESAGHHVTPVWSPDATELVFASNLAGSYSIYRLQPGSPPVRLTDNTGQDIHPAWSPDGQQIIFTSDRGGGFFQIYTITRQGDELQQVGVVPGNHAMYPRFSPDGAQIAFMRASIAVPACDWNWDIWLMNANGQNQQRVTTYLAGDLYPNWTPDGHIIYASCANFLTADLYIRNLNTGTDTQVTSSFWTNEWAAVYSPTGDTIAYNSDATGKTDVHLKHLFTGSELNLTANPLADDGAPTWQGSAQDSTLIAGQVVRFGGRPLENADVSLGPGVTTKTNKHGYYYFDGLPAGEYTITVTFPDYQFTPPQRVVSVPSGQFSQNFVGKNCASATAVQPILMVTGWSGSVNDNMATDMQLKYFHNWLEGTDSDNDYGYMEGCNLFYARGTTASKSLYQNAHILRQEICTFAAEVEINNQTWNNVFDVIAFSYGGLRMRALLENDTLYQDGVHCPGRLQPVRVRNLFMMGTPNGGAWPDLPLAALIGAMAVVRGNEWIAFLEMAPPIRAIQNARQRQPQEVCYHLIGGDARLQWPVVATFLLVEYLTGHYGAHVLSTPNDLAVQQESVHILSSVSLTERYPQSRPVFTDDLHGDIPYVHLKSYVNPETTFAEEMWAYITQMGDCALPASWLAARSPGETSILGLIAEQQQPQPTANIPLLDLSAGLIGVGEIITGTFPVVAAGPTTVHFHWSEGDVELSLTDPQGQLIDQHNAADNENVTFTQLNSGLGLMASYAMTYTLAGSWQYTVTAVSLPDSTPYRLTLIPTSAVAVSGAVPGWTPAGHSVTLFAVVNDRDEPVIGGQVTARIQRPDGLIEEVSLFDDGQHGDAAANDGLFAAVYQPPGGGVYGVLFTATGLHNSEMYERTATAVFTVAPAYAHLTGQYSDRGVSYSPLNLFEKLEVSVGLDVIEPGPLAITADLYAGDIFIAQATTTILPAFGQHSAPLLFDGSLIRASGLNGPYTVRNLLLLDESGVTLLMEVADHVHTTAAYQYHQFGKVHYVNLPLLLR